MLKHIIASDNSLVSILFSKDKTVINKSILLLNISSMLSLSIPTFTVPIELCTRLDYSLCCVIDKAALGQIITPILL